ncbi:MAG: hypothetical protein KC431_02130 [Myxococcales bacterium]|nr:hypothetical protein [Myxococcales bacterium]
MTRNKARRAMLAVAAAMGTGLGLLDLSGCILPDYCIEIRTAGKNNCIYLENAKMWPLGQPELAEAVPPSDDAPGPAGCLCMNDAEQEILDYGVPEAKFQEMLAEIENAARDNCDAIVPAGWDHNCYITEGVGASVPHADPPAFVSGKGSCFGSCAFINPPPNGTCPELNPYECNGSGDDEGGGGGLGGSEGVGDVVTCQGNECTIDSDYARMLIDDPGLLSNEDTRLVFDGAKGRFVAQSFGSSSSPAIA